MSWHHEHFNRGPELFIGANIGPPMWEETLPPVNPAFYQSWNNPGACFGNNYLDCPPLPVYPQQAFYSTPVYAPLYAPIVPRAHIGFGGPRFHFGITI